MTREEWMSWRAETAESQGRWLLDEITLLNRGAYLFYRGGENGRYVEVTADGFVTVGTYAGAIPHIGEALFGPRHTGRVAETAQETLERVPYLTGLVVATAAGL